MKFKFKPEKVAFVYVENITFAVVMKDDKGNDVLINDEGIELDSQTKAELSDQVLAHIREGKAAKETDLEFDKRVGIVSATFNGRTLARVKDALGIGRKNKIRMLNGHWRDERK